MTEGEMVGVLRDVATCASRWDGDARLVGNVRAADIFCACVLAVDTIEALRIEIKETTDDPKGEG